MQRWETRQGLKSFIITMSAFRPGWMKQTSLKRFALSITYITYISSSSVSFPTHMEKNLIKQLITLTKVLEKLI